MTAKKKLILKLLTLLAALIVGAVYYLDEDPETHVADAEIVERAGDAKDAYDAYRDEDEPHPKPAVSSESTPPANADAPAAD